MLSASLNKTFPSFLFFFFFFVQGIDEFVGLTFINTFIVYYCFIVIDNGQGK